MSRYRGTCAVCVTQLGRGCDGVPPRLRGECPRVSRPRQIHLQMEDDGVISAHVKGRFTEDDREGGVIFGTHTNFAKTNTDALKAANVLLQQIRKTENSFGRQYVRKFGPVAQVELPDRLVLIACSHARGKEEIILRAQCQRVGSLNQRLGEAMRDGQRFQASQYLRATYSGLRSLANEPKLVDKLAGMAGDPCKCLIVPEMPASTDRIVVLVKRCLRQSTIVKPHPFSAAQPARLLQIVRIETGIG